MIDIFQVKAVLAMAVDLYRYILLGRIIFSWIGVPSSPLLNKLYVFIYDVTEPFLRLFRGLIPMVNLGGMGLDLSPLIAFLVLGLIKSLILSL